MASKGSNRKNNVEFSLLVKDIHRCLKRWNKSEGHSMRIFGKSAIFQIEKGLLKLMENDSFDARLLSLRFVEGRTILSIAHQLNLSQDQINRRQRMALHELAQIIWRKEISTREENKKGLIASLPPKNYENLYGAEQIHKKILPVLREKNNVQIIALTGLGGIGKSAIADSLLRALSQNSPFSKYIWLRLDGTGGRKEIEKSYSRQKLLRKIIDFISDVPVPSSDWESFIRSYFSKNPCLLALDNLNEEPLPASFFDLIIQLVAPGKVILTSRAKIPAGEGVFQVSVPEINQKASKKLIQDYAKMINLPASQIELEKNASKIFHITGGNPLAIRLALGLLLSFPLAEVLHSLERSPHSDVEAMYRYIYQKSWQALSVNAQNLLQAMPLVSGKGANWAHLEVLSGEKGPKLVEIVKELSSRSLFELCGTLNEPIYGIHQLTDTFIRNDVLQWM